MDNQFKNTVILDLESIKENVHEFLTQKGVTQMDELHCAHQIELWLIEFAEK